MQTALRRIKYPLKKYYDISLQNTLEYFVQLCYDVTAKMIKENEK